MSVLIRGAKMPATCEDCPFFGTGYGGQWWCHAIDAHVVNYPGRRDEHCPLVEAKPHGRLIDADALHIQLIDKELDQLQPWTSFDDYREVLQMIDDAPTIIESEVDDG